MEVEKAYWRIDPLTAADVVLQGYLRRRGTVRDRYIEFARSLGGQAVADFASPWDGGLLGIAFESDPGPFWCKVNRGITYYRPRKGRTGTKLIRAQWPAEQIEGLSTLAEALGFGHSGGVIIGNKMYCALGLRNSPVGWLVAAYEFFGVGAPSHSLVEGLVRIEAAAFHAAAQVKDDE